MKDKVQRFIDNIGGNFVEISYREAIYQCMDLAYAWVFALDIPKSTIQHLYAYEVYTKPRSITKEYFDLLKNTPDFIPQAGDLAVWKGGTAGHIGICTGEGDVNFFKVFEQNNPLGSNAQVHNRSYVNIIGFLRPKQKALPVPEPVIENDTIIPQIIDDNGNAMEVQAIASTLKDTKKALKSANANLEARVKEAIEKTRAEELKNCNERVKTAETTLKTEHSTKIADLKAECKTKLKDANLKYEVMVWKKVDGLSPFALFRLGLKKLFRRTGK
jgi:hypothetical protein